MLIFMFFFDGFWSGLGVLLGSLLEAKKAQNRSKIGPEGSRNHTLLKKVIFHETSRFTMLFALFGPQDGAHQGPRSRQEGSKRVPMMIFHRIDS